MPDTAVLRVTSAYALTVLFLALIAPPASAATQEVMMQGYAFSPATMTVHVGDTVTWMQHDEAPHDATTTSAPASFHSPELSQGQSWSYTFRQPGTYAYYCSVHPDMRASITVLPAAAAPTTAPPKPAPTAKGAAPVKTPTAAVAPSTTATSAPASTTAPATTQPAVTEAAPATQPSLDPMLLVAGLVTGIAVLCLLLLGSRPS